MSHRRQVFSIPPQRPQPDLSDPEGPGSPLVAREWMVTNGLGGYASGTVSGVITRRFHGLLVAALPAPHGRTMMLNHLTELVRLPDNSWIQLGAQERPDDSKDPIPLAHLEEFSLEEGLPVWRYEHAGFVIEKRLIMPHRQNTTHVAYRLLKGEGTLRLVLEPYVHFRPHEGALDRTLEEPYALRAVGERFEISGPDLPPLRLRAHGARSAFAIEGKRLRNVRYHIEQSRGYDAEGDLYCPGVFRADLLRGSDVTLVASSEPWDVADALTPDEVARNEHYRRARLLAAAHPAAREGLASELVYAADQFLITPAGRVVDATRAHATGDEVRTVIAGYHWFTDWGRDTMISLEGLTLCTGRHVEAKYILSTFAHYVKDGLIPNHFPEGKNAGIYNTADATLWFFHAMDRYVNATQDREALRRKLPIFESIMQRHLAGTHFGIGVDPKDGLLTQGAPGYALTWMDAKVGDLVVTPRRGKAVEINALFYNALRLLERWLREEVGDAAGRPYGEHAARVRASFNARFWNPAVGHLYDIVDGENGDDSAFRPNQLFAIALEHPVLERKHWEPIVQKVRERLLTPVGLRSLAPGHPDYRPRYFGDLRARDLAYHQGTVWGWLIGPFVDAWLKVYPDDRARVRGILEGFAAHMGEACVGQLSEIFDADEPYTPRGCVAQAWSVAELLRCLIKTSG